MRSSITSSFVESKVRLYIKLFVVLHFTVRMHLGMPKKKKNNYQHNCFFLYFLKKYMNLHPTHFKAKEFKIRFEFFDCLILH